ncbi:rab-GTPase-TBC domain-containing protein [Pilobolus umbonatus]|nr:rab-GTPase-TBC domain-containing protein [Pilobolus umbonatus]
MESTYKERLKYFQSVLSVEPDHSDHNNNWTPIIDMKTFREACLYGIPDASGIRCIAWKVLLGYLPPDKRMWKSTLKSQRLSYYNWVKDLLEDPSEEPPSVDHPLNKEPGSKWATYFYDNSILEQIDKDVRRTLPDFAFFQLRVPLNPLNPLSPPLKTDTGEDQNQTLLHELDPLSAVLSEDMNEKELKARRFSFGLMSRPRSSSATSKKSLKINSLTPNSPMLGGSPSLKTRDRSNSRSSVRSLSSGILETGSEMMASPRNIVRKISTAFKSSNNGHPNFIQKLGKKHQSYHQQEPICPYIPSRRSLFRRIAHLNEEIGNREHADNGVKHNMGQQALDADAHVMDYHWEAIERILFIYAKLNPGVGYVQGMNEILAPIYYVFAAKSPEDDPESQAYAEADSFFVFTTLMADIRDHFVRTLDLDASSGINATMCRMSQRLAWFDRPLFSDLSKKEIKEQYYAFRWITVLCSQEWDLPDVIRLWDSILADRGMQEGQDEGRYEFLLDFSVAMLICIRQSLIHGDFTDNMRILQNYPIDDIQIVLNTAYSIRDTRLQAISEGKIIPGVNDRRCSGVFNGDWSDASSMSSTGSGSRFKRLKDTTEMARASFDSLRKGSKESLDDLFKRGLSITRGTPSDDTDRKRASTGVMLSRSLSQKFGFANNIASKVRRASSVRSINNAILTQQTIEEQVHRDWLLANQLNAAENNSNNKQSWVPSSTSLPNVRSSSLVNRLAQPTVGNRSLNSLESKSEERQYEYQYKHNVKDERPSTDINEDINFVRMSYSHKGFA